MLSWSCCSTCATTCPKHCLPNCSATRRLRHLAVVSGVPISRMHPHMLRHTLCDHDAGVSLRDAQIVARHADPRTTMRSTGHARTLDRHANYILAAFMASET